ncbi:MAG: FHA domain-containing protein [Paludibacteraceae bacterium]|nr:FHA domain-containing protein [Paludibacteraceae bacterium]
MDSTIKKTVSGSLGAGVNFLFGNSSSYYILEHKVSSRYHQQGESQKIIVDNIQIGRAEDCEVRFDESFRTVSRHHAGIVRDGNQWKLIHLSEKNSTLLNGVKVQDEWYLQNGDEIQLSINGPKLGFIIPSPATTKTLGLTARMNLFREQALKPYRTAIVIFSVLLLLIIGGAVAYGVVMNDKNQRQEQEIEEEIAKRDSIISNLQKETEQQRYLIEEQIDALKEQKKQLDKERANTKSAEDKAKDAIQKSEDIQKQIDALVDKLNELQAEPQPKDAQNNSKIKIGDVIKVDGKDYIVANVNDSGEHGFAIYDAGVGALPYSYIENKKIPSIDEFMIVFKNKSSLKYFSGSYWSSKVRTMSYFNGSNFETMYVAQTVNLENGDISEANITRNYGILLIHRF